MTELIRALEHAIDIIEAYQMDIRTWEGGTLLAQGFCQGEIYQSALSQIHTILHQADPPIELHRLDRALAYQQAAQT